MKRSIYVKFIVTYLALAVVILGVVITLGSYLVEKELIREAGRALYSEADQIATTNAERYFSEKEMIPDVYIALRLAAVYQNYEIWIMDTQGNVLLNSADSLYPDTPAVVPSFDAAVFGPGYYEISRFFDYFDTEAIHVIAPVTSKMVTRGYVVIHAPLEPLYANRDAIVMKILLLSGLFLLFSLSILVLFTFSVYRPLVKITDGTLEFARGNLKHRIRIKNTDEVGYLADSMNVMASELDQANEYQKSFIANISHDFRSPLTSIKGFTEAMLDGTIPQEMHGRYLKIINQEADRLENLTQSVLRLNSVEKDHAVLKRTDFDINNVIKDTAALFEGSCRKKKLSIELVLFGEALYVNADEEKIKQVLYNLLDNAIKFSNKNSEIRIETSERRGHCYISVKDHGCGIKKGDLTKIWNRFYKSDNSRGKDRRGTGLGLSIVKEIIKAHGENISVISTEGVGTEFVFSLILTPEEEDEEEV